MFKCQRFVVFEWMLDDLRMLLGPHFEDFYLDEWFHTLSAKADREGLMLDKRQVGGWVYSETLAEAIRRGLTVAAPGAKPSPMDRPMFAPGTSTEELTEGLRQMLADERKAAK